MNVENDHDEDRLIQEALNPSYEVDISVVEAIVLRELVRAELATDKVSVSEAIKIACKETFIAMQPTVKELVPAVFQCAITLGNCVEQVLKKTYPKEAKVHVGLAVLAATALSLNQAHYEETNKNNA